MAKFSCAEIWVYTVWAHLVVAQFTKQALVWDMLVMCYMIWDLLPLFLMPGKIYLTEVWRHL